MPCHGGCRKPYYQCPSISTCVGPGRRRTCSAQPRLLTAVASLHPHCRASPSTSSSAKMSGSIGAPVVRGGRDRRAGDPRGRRQHLRRDRHQQRDEARRQERIAVEQKQIATEQRDQARRRLVQLNVANGSRVADAGDVSAALLWFTEAAKLEATTRRSRTCCAPAWCRSLVGIPAWRKCGLPLRPLAASDSLDGAWVVVYPREGERPSLGCADRISRIQTADSPVVDVAVTPQG